MLFDFYVLNLANFIYLVSFAYFLCYFPNEKNYLPFTLIFIFFPLYLIHDWIIDNEKNKLCEFDASQKISVFLKKKNSFKKYLENQFFHAR